MNKLNLFIFLFISFSLFSCTQKVQKEKIITVTIEPQHYFAEQLAGSLFKIVTMVPAGTSPETYDPSPVQMAQLAKSSAYFQIGKIGFEQAWMDKIRANNPDLPIYDNGNGIEYITSEEDRDGDKKHDYTHVHPGGIDPHTWNSSKEALKIVENMYKALVELDKSNEAVFRKNFIQLKAEIDQTDSTINLLLSHSGQKAFLIYHPALTYFARDYRLNQYCIEVDGKEPSPEQIKTLVEMSHSKGIKTIFIQQEFDKKNAEIVAHETGCSLVSINPLSYHWNEEMIKIAKALSDE